MEGNKDLQKRILLVEDEAIITLMEKNQLEKENYTVLTAASGEEALDIICEQKKTVDLILMDIDLGSGLDGTETAREILKQYNIPILFLSSHTDKEIVEKTEEITNYGYVVKNSNFTVLDASIKMAFKLFESKTRTEEINNKLVATFNAVPDLIFEIDLNGYYHDVRSSRDELLYKPLTDLLGKRVTEVLTPTSAETIMLAIDEANKKGVSTGRQYEIVVPAGKCWFEINVSRVNSYSKIPHFILICHDITEQKKSVQKLKESEARFKALHNATFGGIAIHDKGIILECNQGLAEMTGYSVDELIGMNGLLLIAEKSRKFVMNQILSGIEKPYLAFGVHKNGTEYTLRLEARNIPYKGKTVRTVEIRDITEQKKAEQENREIQSNIKAILENTLASVWAINLDYEILFVNEVFRQDFETAFGICLKKGMNLLESIPEIIRPLWKSRYDRGMKNEHFIFEDNVVNGEVSFFIEVEVNPIIINGKVKGVSFFGRDITKRKLTEQENHRLLNEKEIILKEVHHRVKNNMNTISGLLSLQSGNSTSPEASKILKEASGRVRSMMTLYDKLYMSGVYTELSLQDFLYPLINEIMSILPSEKSVKKVVFITDITIDTPRLSPLGIILYELITNSFKYAFDNTLNPLITISITKSDLKVTLCYSDNGSGIPESINFENSEGFGLQLIQMLVKQIKGTIEINRNKGTEYRIEF